ncbi:hypothetical protein [Bosea sp. TND4EK4]|uniref:hypothetical protein n=1 Tax=Bosea sp. TND4EK4 TaxID=1907408 RepID=UPI000954B3D8|nr:hypothetical protein [Bosea sp. TND4EK4]SIQ01867.1 hypothetical protein SAMN05880592_101578 [Bosea sp. TND4EK4]
MKGTSRSRPLPRPEGGRRQTDRAGPAGATRETFSRFVSNLAKLEGERSQSAKGEANRG